MKKIFKRLRTTNIDVLVYGMSHYIAFEKPDFKFNIEKQWIKKKCRYFIEDSGKLVHQSYLFEKVFLLKSIGKKGPVIGNCYTNAQYRGLSIYPFVINTIAKETLQTKAKEVFVIVNRNNINSIKGIEKAGFVIVASITGKRWLWFYLKKSIRYFN
uniref:hypothetical protein n=1 Tax=Gelidibacter sp. TaxID=2018083 RepID=UPI00404AC496